MRIANGRTFFAAVWTSLKCKHVGRLLNRGSWFHAYTHPDRGSVHAIYARVRQLTRRGREVEGDAGVVDPVSTVSNRIALLPANVCHVWHTRRASRTAVHGRVRARVVRVRACALFSRVTFAASRRDTREFPIAASTACHVAAPNAIPTWILSYEAMIRRKKSRKLVFTQREIFWIYSHSQRDILICNFKMRFLVFYIFIKILRYTI